ncbi:MAG: hypothetical protein ACE5GW_06060, partial [Planctomycetota bacterium]
PASFYRLDRPRLGPGGVAVHWLQLYRIGAGEFAGILSAVRDAMGRVQVFHPPRTGEVILIGGGEPVPRSTWIDRWAAPALEPCLRRIPSLTAPPVPLLDEDGVSRWLARFPHRADRLRERLEFTLPLLGERGEDHSGEILRSLEDAAHRPARDRRGD